MSGNSKAGYSNACHKCNHHHNFQMGRAIGVVNGVIRRMYAAKEAGRNCYVGPSGIAVTGVIGSSRPAFENAEDRARANANARGDLALPDNASMRPTVISVLPRG